MISNKYVTIMYIEQMYLCTLAETKTGCMPMAGQAVVVTISLLFTFIMILLTVRLPTHLEQTKSVCAIINLYVKKLYYTWSSERSE
jgi:hypothetical protein